MAIKKFRPITPARRFMSVMDTSDITSKPTVKSLLVRVKANAGRNNNGRITSRHKEAGAKKLYRIIDFKRDKFDVVGTVATIEYDPYRNCRISLISYADGDKRYIIQPAGLKVGDKVQAAASGLDILPGNAMRLVNIPIGTMVHNIELKPGKGAQFARSAGGYAQIMGREDKYVILRLPSGEMRKILNVCMATIGVVGNGDYINMVIGKAGRTRHLGIRPQTRGSAMNPIDHPHGGGEGRQPIGMHPKTPWGKPALGKKTRKRKNPTSKYIVRRRIKK